MSDYYLIQPNLDLIRSRLSIAFGKLLSEAEVLESLSYEKFEKTSDGWIVKDGDLTTFKEDEVLSVRKIDGDTDLTEFLKSPHRKRTAGVKPVMIEFQSRLKALPYSDQCLVPDFLIGDYRSVVAKSRAVLKRAVKDRNWSALSKGTQFRPLGELNYPLVVDRRGNSREVDNVILFMFGQQMQEMCLEADNVDYLTLISALLIAGLDHFWFCLSVCCTFGGGGFVGSASDIRRSARRETAILALTKMLRWWPYLCACEPRFARLDGVASLPPYWAEAGILATHLGIIDPARQLQAMNMQDAGKILAVWVNSIPHNA